MFADSSSSIGRRSRSAKGTVVIKTLCMLKVGGVSFAAAVRGLLSWSARLRSGLKWSVLLRNKASSQPPSSAPRPFRRGCGAAFQKRGARVGYA